jgi:hypothetical protein
MERGLPDTYATQPARIDKSRGAPAYGALRGSEKKTLKDRLTALRGKVP